MILHFSPNSRITSIFRGPSLAVCMMFVVPAISVAEETRPPYSDAVVEKADGILKEAGLRRSGKAIQSTAAAELTRSLSNIARSRRELRLQQKTLAEAQTAVKMIAAEIDNLNRQDGELNLQLARIAGLDVTSNNRVVALINATRTRVGELRKQRTLQEQSVQSMRSALNRSEEQYAETVFQTRKRLDELSQTIDASLDDPQVRIAIDVMHTNFGVAKEIESEEILRTLDHRLRDIEREVFRETIPLDVSPAGALSTMVSVNQQAIRMVIDSGATLLTLPADAAAKLQVVVSDDAPLVRLTLANGGEINGRKVILESVRVGQFEASNVEAVVLEPITAKAEPLLGLSFLDRYKFQLDSSAKTLGLLRIDDSDAESP